MIKDGTKDLGDHSEGEKKNYKDHFMVKFKAFIPK